MSARRPGRGRWLVAAGITLAAGVLACVTAPPRRAPATEPMRPSEPEVGRSIVIGGEHVWIDAPVVLWFDPGGYSAYSRELRFPDEVPSDPGWQPPEGLRYRPGRETEHGRVTRRSSLEELGQVVDQLVLHYDACGLSRTCFQVLHDRRELSVHFLLDVDGTLYQTLDLADTAWHARQANARSVGVEIANIGAYAPGASSPLDAWYARDAAGVRLTPPDGMRGVRTAGFVARPDRPERVAGVLNGQSLEMHDLTSEQYESLVRLAAALTRVFPRLEADAPRGTDGRVRMDALSEREFEAFGGIVGHHHVTTQKVDPGPAFAWERFLTRVRAAALAP